MPELPEVEVYLDAVQGRGVYYGIAGIIHGKT